MIPRHPALLVIALFALWAAVPASANDCPALLPADAIAVSAPSLCRVALPALSGTFTCQDYRAGGQRYRVLFKGGQVPRGVLRLDTNAGEQVIWLHRRYLQGVAELPRCQLAPPELIPVDSVHRGTGVCSDDDNRAVACSMFEHAVPREEEFHRYMVYYFPGAPRVEKFHAGPNQNALVAEFAYQLGLSLLNTRCCSDEAIGYLEYAYRLFPRADLYGEAWKEARFLLSARAHPTDFALYLD